MDETDPDRVADFSLRMRHILKPRGLKSATLSSQYPPGLRAAVTSLLDYDLAVDYHVIDSGGVLLRLLEGRAVGDGLIVKDHDVGGHSRPQQAAVPQPESLRGQRTHLADGFFHADQTLIADVDSQDARVVAESARVRDAGALGVNHARVRSDHRKRLFKDSLDVLVRHLAQDHLRAARQQQINRLLRLRTHVGLLLHGLRDLGDVLAVERLVGAVTGDVGEREVIEAALRGFGDHLSYDALACGRVLQPLPGLVVSALEEP